MHAALHVAHTACTYTHTHAHTHTHTHDTHTHTHTGHLQILQLPCALRRMCKAAVCSVPSCTLCVCVCVCDVCARQPCVVYPHAYTHTPSLAVTLSLARSLSLQLPSEAVEAYYTLVPPSEEEVAKERKVSTAHAVHSAQACSPPTKPWVLYVFSIACVLCSMCSV